MVAYTEKSENIIWTTAVGIMPTMEYSVVY